MTTKALISLIATKPLLTKSDLAIRFCVSIRTIERWRRTGRLPRPIHIHGPRWTPEVIERLEGKGIE